jgi:hypothetical protein
MKQFAVMLLVIANASVCRGVDDEEIQALRKQVAELTERVTRLERALNASQNQNSRSEQVDRQRTKARERMAKDKEIYSQTQLREIESLYQVANQKWQTEEGKNSLKELVKKYDKANRTGCAILYLGQMSEGSEKEEYLQKAIADFSDCWYGDGVQVGPFARFILAAHLKDQKQNDQADVLLKDLARLYPDAIDHRGQLLLNPN